MYDAIRVFLHTWGSRGYWKLLLLYFFIPVCSILVFLCLLNYETIAPVSSKQVQDFVFLSNMKDTMLPTNFTVVFTLLLLPITI